MPNAIYVKKCSLITPCVKIKMNPDITRTSGLLGRTVSPSKLICLLTMAALLLTAVGNANAMEIAEWRFQTSIYTHHWSSDPDHVSNSKLLGIEFETTNRWIGGFGYFDNSFGQPSQYLYAGYEWPLFKTDWAYFKLTGGLLHGYKDPYEDKIPLNGLGIAPAIVPAFGFKYKRVLTEIQILGTAALTWTVGFNFGQKSD
jgi:hypothetical protein